MEGPSIRLTLLLSAAAAMAACGPTISDIGHLPNRVTTCGWDWGYDSTVAPRTLADIRADVGEDPPVLDLSAMVCPRGACTKADVAAGLTKPHCQDRIWVRVGWDAYAQYGMLFRL
jgi:hypothetical protein